MTAAEPAGRESMNLKQVASELHVHYMTAYRYVRQGLLDAERSGTGWVVSPAALARFTASAARAPLAARAPSGPGTAGASTSGAPWPARLERHLVAGDEVAAWRVVESALASAHDLAYCYTEMLGGALASIGARGEAGELDLADQHLATAVASRVVSRLGARVRRPGRSRGVVVFGAPLGELHGLPIAMAADLVRLGGFDVLELGADVPPAVFAAAATRSARAVAVGVGVTRAEHLPAAQAVVDSVRAAVPRLPVLLGGLATGDPAADAVRGVDALVREGDDVVSALSRVIRAGARRPGPDAGDPVP